MLLKFPCPCWWRPESIFRLWSVFTMTFMHAFLCKVITWEKTSAVAVKLTISSNSLYLRPHSTWCWDYMTNPAALSYKYRHHWTQFLLSLICPLLKRQGRSEGNPLYRSVSKSGEKKSIMPGSPRRHILTLCEWQVKSPLCSRLDYHQRARPPPSGADSVWPVCHLFCVFSPPSPSQHRGISQ